MITHKTEVRVRYGEVDQMQFLYHAHYVDYFDVARTEFIRALGITNKEMEARGLMLPVINVNINYGIPANYDDLLTIHTTLKEMPGVKITFHYEVFRGEQKLTTGSVTLAFMDSATNRAIRPPQYMIDLFSPHFNK